MKGIIILLIVVAIIAYLGTSTTLFNFKST